MSKRLLNIERATMATGSTAVANSISKPEGLGRKRSNSHACCTTCCREDNRLRGRVKTQHGFPTVDCRGPLSSSNNREKRRARQSLQCNSRNNRAALSFSNHHSKSIGTTVPRTSLLGDPQNIYRTPKTILNESELTRCT